MEKPLSSLTFRGSILEAISEAKLQRKLFVVYISGDGAESSRMENTTWSNDHVSDSLTKYCIFLHLLEGSTDAANFSKIYPQKSVPCITSVGYNGVKLWQHEGFVNAEDLVSTLEKAYLSLHIQETTASVLTAALAARTSGASTSQPSTVTATERGIKVDALPSNGQNQSSEGTSSKIIKEKRGAEESIEPKDTDQSSLRSNYPTELENVIEEESSSNDEAGKESSHTVSIDRGNAEGEPKFPLFENGCMTSGETKENLSEIVGGSSPISDESNLATVQKPSLAEDTTTGDSKPTQPSSSSSNDVHLNIRLPSGVSLQEKFLVTSTLRMVKDYVDENQSGEIGPYDLAIPYPRKVFNNQDLSKSLSELELLGRQALIVVPCGRGRSYSGGVSVSPKHTNSIADTSDGNSEGYVAFARKLLSYLNPFSYLGGGGGSSSSAHYSENVMREDRPYPDGWSGGSRAESLYSRDSTNQATSGRNEVRSRRPTASSYGSNIHTLKHDEDDPRFGDRNAFWNGNSTQYGGDGNGDGR